MNFNHSLEEDIHYKISYLFDDVFSTDNVIKKRFGKDVSGIDHICLIGDNFISIQDKSGHYDISDVGHFINATKNMISKGYNLIHAYFVCHNMNSPTILDIIDKANEDTSYDKYIICDIDVDKLHDDILNVLVSNNIRKIEFDIKLKKHQKKALSNFKRLISDDKRCIILQHIMGADKTKTALEMINHLLDINPEYSILWMTERIDILKSQFDRCEIQEIGKNLNDISIVRAYNKLNMNDIEDRCFLITNVAKIRYDTRYESMRKFDVVILDECHNFGADENYKMIRYMKDNWNPYIIGLSATPIRKKYINRYINIFGDNDVINYIDTMTVLKAIEDGIIVNPRFYWIEVNADIKSIDVDDGFRYVKKMIRKSKTKRIICWCRDIQSSRYWTEKLEDEDYIVYESNSRNDIHGNNIMKFISDKRDDVVILNVVGRCREGFNFERVDTCIHLDAVKERGDISFLQSSGRCLRKYKDKRYGNIIESFTYQDEDDKIKHIINKIIGYPLFIELIQYMKKKDNVHLLNIKFDEDKKRMTFKIDDIKIESNIICDLKSFKWDLFTKEFKERLQKEVFKDITYDKMKLLLRDMNITFIQEYTNISRRNIIFPESPYDRFNINEDIFDWFDYLSIDTKVYNFKDIKDIIRTVSRKKNIKDVNKILDICCTRYDIFPSRDLCECYFTIKCKTKMKDLLIEYRRKRY